MSIPLVDDEKDVPKMVTNYCNLKDFYHENDDDIGLE